jgi:hypothetical protein
MLSSLPLPATTISSACCEMVNWTLYENVLYKVYCLSFFSSFSTYFPAIRCILCEITGALVDLNGFLCGMTLVSRGVLSLPWGGLPSFTAVIPPFFILLKHSRNTNCITSTHRKFFQSSLLSLVSICIIRRVRIALQFYHSYGSYSVVAWSWVTSMSRDNGTFQLVREPPAAYTPTITSN